MGTILYVFIAFAILLLMVTIHEFGHYIVGKILKFKINEFSIGFGSSIFTKKCKNGEIFSVRWIPLGGYCAFEGEDSVSNDEQSFEKQAPWKRILVLIAGGIFNIVSGIIFSVILLATIGYDVVQVRSTNIAVVTNSYTIESEDLIYSIEYLQEDFTKKIIVCSDLKDEENKSYFFATDDKTYLKASYLGQFIYEEITENQTKNFEYKIKKLSIVSPNESQGDYYNFDGNIYYKDLKDDKIAIERIYNDTLKPNDAIYKVNGERVGFNIDKQVTTMIKNCQDENIILTVKRNGEFKDVTVNAHNYTIVTSEGTSQTTSIGVTLSAYRYGFFEALSRAIPFTFEICVAVIEILGQLIIGQGLSTVGGPITTIATIAGFSQKSMSTILLLLPLISANLGVFNLMPIPALDGSKVVFCLIEWIRKKPINRDIENKIHSIGFLILMGLVIIADLYQVFFAHIFKTLFG